MPLFIAALIGGLIQAAASFVGRALIALGVGLVSYAGVSVLLDALKAETVSLFASAGPYVAGLALLKVDVCVSILFSAVAARLLLNGLTGGAIKRWVVK